MYIILFLNANNLQINLLFVFFGYMFVVEFYRMTNTAEPTTPQQEEKEQTFGQTIDFSHFYRVIGTKELMWPATKMNKSKMVIMSEFLGPKKVTTHVRNLQCLDDFVFYKSNGEKIKMENVFDNLNYKFGEDLELKYSKEMMEIMVPDYDPDKFKMSHGEKVLGWYLEIRSKIKKNSE